MSLVPVDVPDPLTLRGGWAAKAAVLAAQGKSRSAWAKGDEWFYDDGGGNWAAIRFQDSPRAVLIGNDHEYSDTYFREAATYFGEEETDLLAGAPAWWEQSLDGDLPNGQSYVGFIYGWDGEIWQRSAYDKNDGFTSVGLVKDCIDPDMEHLLLSASKAPGWADTAPDPSALAALVAADADVTEALVEAAVPGWDAVAGVQAARAFLR